MIKSLRLPYVLFLAAATVLVFVPHRASAQDGSGAVFAMTNAASNNQINAYSRREDGSLEFSGAFPTGGNGSGGTLDPLHSQGSLTLHERSTAPSTCRLDFVTSGIQACYEPFVQGRADGRLERNFCRQWRGYHGLGADRQR